MRESADRTRHRAGVIGPAARAPAFDAVSPIIAHFPREACATSPYYPTMSSNLNLDDLIANLEVPGRTLAFCDETNLTEQATADLVANLRLHVGVVMAAKIYAPAAADLAAFLETHGLPEFHAAEVVNGKKNTPWQAVSYETRLDAFERMTDTLSVAGSRIPYLYLSEQQHDEMVTQSGGLIVSDYKQSLKTVFLTSMAEYLDAEPSPILLIDRDKNTPGPVLHQMSHPGALLGGGAISVESHKVIGLQIADMAAYVVRRYLFKKTALHAGNGSPFDEIATKAVASFHERFDFLLAPEPIVA